MISSRSALRRISNLDFPAGVDRAAAHAFWRAPPGRPGERGYLIMAVAMLLAVLAAMALIANRAAITGSMRIGGESQARQLDYVIEAAMTHALWQADQADCGPYTDIPFTPFGAHSYSAQFSPTSGSPIAVAATGTLANGITRTAQSGQQTVYQAPTETTLQPDAATAQDTFVDAGQPDWNNGIDTTLRVRDGPTDTQHSLLRFVPDPLPQRAKLQSAVLELTAKNISAAGPIAVHRMTQVWSEGDQAGAASAGSGATWDSRDAGEPWAAAGGDYDSTPVATTTVAIPAGSWTAWDVTSLVAGWLSGAAVNNGLILVPGEATVDVDFHSSDSSDPAMHPRLVLAYACECGVGGDSGSVMLQPGAAAGKDAFVQQSQATRNFGAKKSMTLYDAAQARSIIEFDLSSLPPGALVTSAQLQLHVLNVIDDGMAEAHRVTSPWIEGTCDAPGCTADGATWNTSDGTMPWVVAGGDHDMSTGTVASITDQGWVSWDVTAYAAGWADGSYPNYGVLLHPHGGVNADLASSDGVDPALHPRLIVQFNCPCGVDCVPAAGGGGSYCDADFAATAKAWHFKWPGGAAEVTGIDFLPEGTIVNGVTIPTGGGWIMTDRNKDKFFVSDVAGAPLTDFPTGIPDARGIAFIEAGPWAGHIAVADKSDDTVYFLDLDGTILGSFPTAGITTDPYGLSFIGATDTGVYEHHLAISSNKDGAGATIGAVYIVDQAGILKKSIDVDAHAPLPQGVAHLTGDNKLLVADRDGPISIIDFDGTVLNQYDAATWAYVEMQAVTIHPETCEHIISDKTAKSVAALTTGGAGIYDGTARLLMVVSNPGDLSDQEQAKQALFEGWGYSVTLIDDQDSAGEYAAAVAVNDVAFIGEDVSASKLGSKLADAAIGIVIEEPNLSDEFGLSTTVGWSTGSSIDVDDNDHYITSPFVPGPLSIFATEADLADLSITLAPDLRVLGSTAAGPMLATLEFGGARFDTLPAAGRRVYLPWGGSNFQLDNLTADGETILKRSLEWGVQPPPRCDADFAANNLVAEFPWMPGTNDIQGIDYLPAGLIVNGTTVPAGGGWIMNDKNKDVLFVTDLGGNPLTDFPILAFDSQGVALIDAGHWIHFLAVADKSVDRVYYLNLDGDIAWSFTTAGITTNPLGIGFIGATASVSFDNHLAISSDKDASGGGTAAVYIVDQAGVLVTTIDIEAYAPTPQGVTHLNGSDKLLVTDKNGMVSVIDFDGNLLHQYSAAAFGLTQLTDVAIDPYSCEHVIVDKDFDRIALLDASAGGGGGGPGYLEMYLPWAATAPATWLTRNLGVFGVPGNAVVEIAIVNADGGKELWGGVRAMGSTLERRLPLHEAGGGGVDALVMHVQADANGRIEYYSDDPDKLSFAILGYWTGAVYTERWVTFKAGASGGWQTHAMSGYGVAPGDVAELLMVNNDGFFEHQAGVRGGGSGLARLFNLHEAKDGGDEIMSLFTETGSGGGASVELYAADDAAIDFYLLGHWTAPPGDYTEAFADLGTASAKLVWEDADLGPFGVPANAVARIAPVNGEDGAEAFLGVRAPGSGMMRTLELHESENGGDDFAAMHVNADAGSLIQWYDEDNSKIHGFYLLGWWQLP